MEMGIDQLAAQLPSCCSFPKTFFNLTQVMTKLPFSLYCDKEILKGTGICALLIFLQWKYVCLFLYAFCGCASGSQKRALSLLELELEAA